MFITSIMIIIIGFIFFYRWAISESNRSAYYIIPAIVLIITGAILLGLDIKGL